MADMKCVHSACRTPFQGAFRLHNPPWTYL